MKEIIDTYCGLSCEKCGHKETYNCGSCIATKGKPFHGECEIANCATKKNVRFCGECESFPCEIITRYSNDEEHGDSPKGARIERCKMFKNTLVKEAREGINPISYCGFHCDYCFLAQWCGGCRSDYNCCSFATVCEGKLCPNVQCAKEKELNGCYECDELTDCLRGFYSKTDEYLAKAAALFIKKHGKDLYPSALKNAIADGLNKMGSIEDVLRLFEKHIK